MESIIWAVHHVEVPMALLHEASLKIAIILKKQLYLPDVPMWDTDVSRDAKI